MLIQVIAKNVGDPLLWHSVLLFFSLFHRHPFPKLLQAELCTPKMTTYGDNCTAVDLWSLFHWKENQMFLDSHVRSSRRMGKVISCICDCVSLSVPVFVCPHSKRKMAQTINTKVSRHVVHGKPSTCKNSEVKDQSARSSGYKIRYQRGFASEYDCAFF